MLFTLLPWLDGYADEGELLIGKKCLTVSHVIFRSLIVPLK